jgi:pimeloyl-ACP methyl ester carboxylesterase
MVPVYFISGLGADGRVYEYINVPAGFEVRHIVWIEPEKKESLVDYTKRISNQIDASNPFILVGMSLGGIIAIELNKMIHPLKTIILSTASTPHSYSGLFHFIRLFQLHKLIPVFLLRIPSPPAYWLFGLQNKRERLLLRSFMRNVTNLYLKWSIDKVINWSNNFRPERLTHIHGTKDRIFPFKSS